MKHSFKDFYKEQYLLENARTEVFDKAIQFPTTLIIIFIGATLYSYNEYFSAEGLQIITRLDYFFVTLFLIFFISIIITIWFLYKVFHGFTRKYAYLPNTEVLFSYKKTLYKHYYKYSDSIDFKNKRIDAWQKTGEEFENIIGQYYINNTSFNQKINDRRAGYYSIMRTFLFIDLTLLTFIGTIGILN